MAVSACCITATDQKTVKISVVMVSLNGDKTIFPRECMDLL